MNRRVTSIDSLTHLSVDASSVIQIGDSDQIRSCSVILAVQREKAVFFENEFNFQDYAFFSEPIPKPHLSESIRLTTCKEAPVIRVHKVNVPFVAASSVIHIGSSDRITSEARVKNIRHLLREKS
jgi:spore germination protein PE